MTTNPNPPSSDEWISPSWVVALARAALSRTSSPIELDPCSTERANKYVIQAKHFYTKEEDGLTIGNWYGTAYMNPPYTRGLIDKFVTKLLTQYQEGNVTAAVILTNNVTETAWAQALFENCKAWYYPKGRVHFLGPDLAPVENTRQGQVIWYLGPHHYLFYDAVDSQMADGILAKKVES